MACAEPPQFGVGVLDQQHGTGRLRDFAGLPEEHLGLASASAATSDLSTYYQGASMFDRYRYRRVRGQGPVDGGCRTVQIPLRRQHHGATAQAEGQRPGAVVGRTPRRERIGQPGDAVELTD